ncbi:unnamed protein product [Schistocephalus solidus]|uniref:Tight junction-associated protein 1 n=1 Tax=Schistocephalus solidus TaxID=70667 RepID=A0A183TSU3_SCHSO|nr:unnamed protein product [Schistocephalus solidus]
MTTESLHQTVQLGSKAPPPRPKPPMTFAKAHYQSIVTMEYPKGKNPFGDDDDEDETSDLNHGITTPTLDSKVSPDYTSTNASGNHKPDERPPEKSFSVEDSAAYQRDSPVDSSSTSGAPSKLTNPFDTLNSVDEDEATENNAPQLGIADFTPANADPSLCATQTTDEGGPILRVILESTATQAVSNSTIPKNPFDALVDSEDEDGGKPQKGCSPTPSSASNLPTSGICLGHRQKRHAPPPPPSVHAPPSPLTILANTPSLKNNGSDCYSSEESHLSSEISDGWPCKNFAIPREGGTLSQGHPSPRKDPLDCTRQLSVSLENSLNCRRHLSKGPAPPLPHAEKRQVRADSSTDFVKYDVLRKRIEELSEKIVHVDDELKDANNKLAKS